MEKASFTPLNKLFEIDATEIAYKVFLMDKNLLMLINSPKPFIIPIFPWLAPLSLVPSEHFVLKDLTFYEVGRLANSETLQACLEEQERKHQEGTLRQAPTAGRPSSSFVVRPPNEKKKEFTACPVRRARTSPPISPFSPLVSSSSSSSSSSDGPEARVDRVVTPIICEEEDEEENMASNSRAEFRERQHKRLSKSIVVNLIPSKKACPKPASIPPPMPIPSVTTAIITPESDEKPLSADDISYQETRRPFVTLENFSEESFKCMTSFLPRPKLAYVPNQEEIYELLKRIHSFTEKGSLVQNMGVLFPTT